MKMPLILRFGLSSSSQYAPAVRLAESLPGYGTEGEGRRSVHRLDMNLSLADDALWPKLELLSLVVGSGKSSSAEVDGVPWKLSTLACMVSRIRDCHAEQVRSGGGDDYCSGKTLSVYGTEEVTRDGEYFGCQRLHAVTRNVDGYYGRRGQSWIRYGTLVDDGARFRVDKKGILRVLRREARQELCQYCPAFRVRRLQADVATLPDVVELGVESRFEVHTMAGKACGLRVKPPVREVYEPAVAVREPEPARQVPAVRFADVAGQDDAIAQVRKVVELPLRHAQYFEALGVQPQRGILLYGPPGNGKTLLARAAAGECGAHFERINGPEVLSKWVGETEANLRRIFARAHQFAPSLVLIDEIDSIAPRREHMHHQHDIQLISQLLVLLDGLEDRGQVMVLATTNRVEALDPAICRPGRFDRHVEVTSPDRAGRAAILRVHLGRMSCHASMPIERVAERTVGWSGADLALLCREAGLRAVERLLATGGSPQSSKVMPKDLLLALRSFSSTPTEAVVGAVNVERTATGVRR